MSTTVASHTPSATARLVASTTTSHQVPNGTLVTLIEIALGQGKTVSTVTVGGTSASSLAVSNVGGARYETWYLANPATGLKSIVVSPSATCDMVVSATSLVPNAQSGIYLTGSAPSL